MGDNSFQIFMEEGCIKSKEIISFLNKTNQTHNVINIREKHGFELAQKEEIVKIPTILLRNKKGKVEDIIYTLNEIKELVNS